MSTRLGSGSRWAWRWCLVYSALVPSAAGDRRRAEVRSHLWESDSAGLPQASIRRAALRGIWADLAWIAQTDAHRLAPSMGRPMTYVVVAMVCPMLGVWAGRLPLPVPQHAAASAGFVFLALAFMAHRRKTRA